MLAMIKGPGANPRRKKAGASAPVNTVLPVISGTATEFQTLTVSNGTWTGTPTITYTYQWKRAGVSIAGATASSYSLIGADVGAAITCAVTATNASGSVTATSSATASVASYLISLSRVVHFSAIDSMITQSGGKITAINDISGNANHLALSSAANECTYNAAYAGANNKPTFVFTDSSHDTHFRVPANITAQEFYVVAAYKDGTDATFDDVSALVAGSGSFGNPKIAGSAGTAQFAPSVLMNYDGKGAKNYTVTTVGNILPMKFAIYRFTLSAVTTERFYFFGGPSSPVGWRGPVSEVIALASPADSTTRDNIITSLRAKYAMPQYEANALFVGQSVYQRALSVSVAGPYFTAEAAAQGFTNFAAINGSKDSTSVLYEADAGSGAWLDSSDTGKGSVYTGTMEPAVAATGLDNREISHIFVLIGNTDCVALNAGTITEAQHKAGFLTYCNLLKAEYPNAKIIITPNLGNTGLTDHTSWTAIKRAQWQVMNESGGAFPQSFGTFDLPRTDPEHLTNTGAQKIMQRNARLAAYLNGVGTPNNPKGPKIASATYSAAADTVTATVAYDANGNATDYTMSDAKRFNITVNGTVFVPATVHKDSSTQFTLSGGGLTISPGDTVTLDWPSGTSSDMSVTNMFLDNATNILPLRPVFGLPVN